MADFQLVDPRGWEYDLQSVRNSIPALRQYKELTTRIASEGLYGLSGLLSIERHTLVNAHPPSCH